MTNKIAQINIAPPEGFDIPGFQKRPEDAPVVLNNLVSTVVGVISAIAFIYFVIQILLAAVSIISAGSDKAKLEEARAKIVNSVIGLVLVIAAIFLVEFVGSILGISILKGILNIPGL